MGTETVATGPDLSTNQVTLGGRFNFLRSFPSPRPLEL